MCVCGCIYKLLVREVLAMIVKLVECVADVTCSMVRRGGGGGGGEVFASRATYEL